MAKSIANLSPAEKELSKLTLPNLKRKCISMGAPFELVLKGSVPSLSDWFVKNYNGGKNRDNSLLDEYDKWHDALLKSEGKFPDDPHYQHLFDPSIKMGFSEEETEEGETKPQKKPRGFRKPKKKKKKERNKKLGNVFQGTKKEYTFKCIIEKGYSDKKTIRRVKRNFPDANDKSIKIWIKKAKKQLQNGDDN